LVASPKLATRLLAARSHSIALASFAHAPGGAAKTTARGLLLAGFARHS